MIKWLCYDYLKQEKAAYHVSISIAGVCSNSKEEDATCWNVFLAKSLDQVRLNSLPNIPDLPIIICKSLMRMIL